MENKEIYIDGVDVSGCAWCDYEPNAEPYCRINDGEDLGCQDNPNCYYKQLQYAKEHYIADATLLNERLERIIELEEKLKRKEQECEELKKELHKNFEEKDTLHLIIDRLLEASGYDTNTASAEDFEDVYEHMRYEQQQLDQLKRQHQGDKGLITSTGKMNYQLLQEYDKLKTALTEIKEIVKNGKRFAERYMITGEQKANVLTYANTILQKISECEVGDDNN